MDDEARKPHRKRQAGRKADKKTDKKKKTNSGQANPKAFAYNSAKSAEKAFHRTADVLEKKHHPLVVDRKSELPPPVVVVVVGPPKVGKTTLVQALVKQYTKKRISKVQGPITVVSGKGENKTTKRLTFIESSCDVHCMIDVAKVADLVILMMNAEKKHQMETFEFLTLCRAHNFTKILGVVTHLDQMKTTKLKKKKKKMLKMRFWTEVCQGAKVHFLDGFDKASYMKNQVRLLSHSINRVKYAPRTWLMTHPYIIADRMEDITNPDELRKNPVVERTVCLYGYVRGTLFNSQTIHIPGCGDYIIQNISSIADPCPPLDQIKKRSLNDRERRLYAPMSGVGGILYDRDAIYMDIGGSHALRTETKREGEIGELITSLQNVTNTIDEKIASGLLGLEQDASDAEDDSDDEEGASDMDVDDDDDDDDDEDNSEDDDDEDSTDEENEEGESDDEDDDEDVDRGSSRKRKRANGTKDLIPMKKRKGIDEEDGSEEESDEDTNDQSLADAAWKKDLREKGIEAFHGRRGRLTMDAIIYNPPQNILPLSDEEADSSNDEWGGGLLRPLGKKHRLAKKCWIDDEECSAVTASVTREEADDKLISRIRDCFVTGKFAKGEDASGALEYDDEMYGDFEDLEKDGEDGDGDASGDDESESDEYYGSEDDDDEDKDSEDGDEKAAESTKPPADETPEERRERRMKAKLLAKKKRQKALFNSGGLDSTKEEKTYYEMQREEMQKQAELNRSEFKNLDEETRLKIEGFRPGLYVRVELKIDCEFVKHFEPTYPIILGGILPKEDELGFVTAKIQVHRYQKIPLRDRDPSMISLGWRRMESTLLFSMQQDNLVYKTLKMARPCVSCTATFWGPMTPQGTSILLFSTDPARKFRITAVGSVSKQDKSIDITKKVPLIGYPFKIFNKTAFIKDMFSSSLEVAKFENAGVQTVSGIRGTIKKVAGEGPPGTFRATFEDKILQSDIIILKATTTMDMNVNKYWQTVPTHLLPLEERGKWVGMKSRYQLEQERNVKREFKPDSAYKLINRTEKVFRPFSIPRELQKELPYKDKPKIDIQRKDVVQSSRIAVIKEPIERRRDELMKKILMVEQQKRSEERLKMRSRAAAHGKKMAVIDAKKQAKAKVNMKKAYAKAGQAASKKKSE